MNLAIDSVIKVSLIVVLGLVASVLMRRQSAALRHWMLSAAILCGAAVPLLGLVMPSWQVATAPAALRADPPPTTGAATSSRATQQSVGLQLEVEPGPNDSGTGLGLLAPIWLTGVAITGSFLLVGYTRLMRLASRARRLTAGTWFDLAADISREYRVRRPVILLRSAHPALLVTWGLRQPKILVPAEAEQWDEHRIGIVLRHEIAHIRRHDWIVQLVAEIMRCIYWFNPLVWLACRRLRDQSEHACDDVVLARGVEASAYATQLLELARVFATEHRSWSAAPAMARSCSLERRIAIMLTPRVNRSPLTRSVRAAIGLAMFGVTAAIAGAVFAQAPTARFSGLVTDPSGAPLPETTITLTHRQTTAGHAMPTDQSGSFDFAALPPGEYALEARTPGFAALRQTITLSARETVRRDIRLNIGTVQESITVGAGASRIVPMKDPSRVKTFVDKLRGQRLQPPLKIKDVRPEYSQALRDAGIEGRVVLEGRISTDGSVTDIRVIESAHEELVNAARDAASQWRFEPTRLWGNPVETTMTMTFNFVREPR